MPEYQTNQSSVWNKHISFSQQHNYQIHAPSGKGKSTLIAIIYGLLSHYNGQVLIDNKNLTTKDQNRLAQLRQNTFSVVFQDLRLFGNLTAKENLALKASLTPDYSLNQGKIESLAKALSVKSLLDKPVNVLSFGERQRFAIIRALIQPFKWLLLDEPFSHLDQKNIDKCATLIQDECKKQEASYIITNLGFHYPLSKNEITYEL